MYIDTLTFVFIVFVHVLLTHLISPNYSKRHAVGITDQITTVTFYAGEGAYDNITKITTFDVNDDNSMESDEVLVVFASLSINDSITVGSNPFSVL